jgi:hypothetical protein
MTATLKEPVWTPAEIPGLVRKKGPRKTEAAIPVAAPVPEPVVAPEPAPLVEAAKTVTKEYLNGAVAFAEETRVALSPVEAHEELMDCLVHAQTLVQKIRAAADSYYIMCDYLSGEGDQYIPVVDSIMRALKSKDPTLVAELIEAQANEIVDGWQILQQTSDRAVEICKLLTQASRAQTIDSELQAAE